MEINDALVDKLAMLSRLHFNDTEKEEIKSDLAKMIGFIDKLSELDTRSVDPLLHITGNLNILREDIVLQNTGRSEALLNSPVKDLQFFKVPKVIKR
ncbi:MAG: Asp-tRNA(Asn)/Glu-tRNA(Gln) amidotransferase subunit GatC [Ferruginibacter sp.]